MITRFENGQITFSFGDSCIGRDGPGSGHNNGLRIQLYFPKIQWRNLKCEEPYFRPAHKELFISAPTILRVVREVGYWGFGFEVLGFGAAFDYQNQPAS